MIELNSTTNFYTELNSKPCFESSYLGVLEYSASFEIQKKLSRLALEKNQISVIGLQHPEVITLGRRSNEQIDITSNLFDIPIVRSTRGGLATIHSRGQLVIYPIVNLRSLTLGIRDYVGILLQTTKSLLGDYGIETNLDIKGAGLFTKNGKIAFCGIEVSNGITQHGISLNVRNELSLFSVIRSCGIENLQLDRMQNYQIDDSLENLFKKWTIYFKTNMSLSFETECNKTVTNIIRRN